MTELEKLREDLKEARKYRDSEWQLQIHLAINRLKGTQNE